VLGDPAQERGVGGGIGSVAGRDRIGWWQVGHGAGVEVELDAPFVDRHHVLGGDEPRAGVRVDLESVEDVG
jgi:hypothetical protein